MNICGFQTTVTSIPVHTWLIHSYTLSFFFFFFFYSRRNDKQKRWAIKLVITMWHDLLVTLAVNSLSQSIKSAWVLQASRHQGKGLLGVHNTITWVSSSYPFASGWVGTQPRLSQFTLTTTILVTLFFIFLLLLFFTDLS